MTTHPSNVFLLVVDSLRYDRLSCYGYTKPTTPFLDSIAEQGVKFEQAYAPSSWTVPVHASLFSGQLPSFHGSHRKSKSFKKSKGDSLAGALSEEGYQTGGFSANPWLSPELQFDTGFDHFEYLSGSSPFPDEETSPDTKVENLYSITGMRKVLRWAFDGNPFKRFINGFWKRRLDTGAGVERINEAILEWIKDCDGERTFIFANYMDVHDPHYDGYFGRSNLELPPASIRANLSESKYRAIHSKPIDFMSEPDDPARSKELYDQSVRRVDEGIRNLFNSLEEAIDLDDSIIFILGDHGESFGENNYWGHGTYLHEPLIRVPVIMKPTEDLDPINNHQPISLLDIPEFISEITGASMNTMGNTVDQTSKQTPLFAETLGPRANMVEEELANGFEAVIQDGLKLVRNRTTGDTEFVTLDNQDDPSEDSQEQLVTLLDKKWEETGQQVEEKGKEGMTTELRSRLSDLGYL